MSLNGMHPSLHLGMQNSIGKMPIQPTPGNIRKQQPNKPKQRKSRTGCLTCKQKRLKCDETKPFCEQCTKKGIQCEGYATNFKWKSYDEIQDQKKHAPARRKSSGSHLKATHLVQQISDSRSVVAKADTDDEPGAMEFEFRVDMSSNSARSPADLMPPPTRSSQDHSSPFSNHSLNGSPWNEYSASPHAFSSILSNHTPPYNTAFLSPRSEPSPRISVHSMLCDPSDPNVFTPPEYAVKTPQVPAPVVIEAYENPASMFIAPVPITTTSMNAVMHPEIAPIDDMPILVTRTPPPLTALPPLWKEIEFHPSDESDNEDDNDAVFQDFLDIEEIPRHDPESNALIPAPKRRRLNSHVPSDSYDLHLPHLEMEMWDFYDRVTATILSCKNATGENPWRDDLIQRAMVSDPLKHALFALTSFHMKRYRPQEAWARSNTGLSYTNTAFRGLRQVLTDQKAFVDENNIAAMLVLSFSQVWDDPTLDGRTHVLGASKILEKQLREIARKRKQVSPFMRFLYNTWVYLDVLSSLSSGEDPFSLKFFSSTLSPPSTPSSSAGEFSLKSEIDSLLGCAVDLFPLIARMSKVANRLTEKVITHDEVEFIREAIQVRDDLLAWRPPEIDLLQESADTYCQLDDIVRTAEVYRLTALLHLYRTFPPLGRDLQNLADQILNNLLVIPKESHSLCIHIWPLMASGCEQTDAFKRHQVCQRFEDIREKLMIANVDQAIDLLGEVWRRRDAGDRDAGWAKLAKERDWHLLLG